MQAPKALNLKPLPVIVVLAIGVFIVAWFLGQKPFLQTANAFLYDLNFRLQGQTPSEQITLIFLDDISAKWLNKGRNPWHRNHFSTALKKLCDLKARVVGVDAVFSSDSTAAIDSELAGVFSDCNNVVLARTIVGDLQPIPVLYDAVLGDGFIDLPQDRDTVLRRLHHQALQKHEEGVEVIPAFSLEVVRAFFDIDFAFFTDASGQLWLGTEEEGLKLPKESLMIQFKGNFSRFKHYSLSELLSDQVPESAIANKIVLIGTNRLLDRDFFSTPFTRFLTASDDVMEGINAVDSVMTVREPGVAVHAHAIQTLLDQDYAQPISQLGAVIYIVFIIFIGVIFYLGKLSAISELVFWAGGAVTIIISGYLFFLSGIIVETAPGLLVWVLQYANGISWRKYLESHKQRFVTDLLGKNVSSHVAEAMINDIGAVIEGKRQEVTLFFSDIRGFTSISEKLTASETSQLLNHYFGKMLPMIQADKGTVDKLMGDGIMAFYGAPVVNDNHANQAAKTALAMVTVIKDMQTDGIKGCETLMAGIGLNTGDAVIGVLGSQDIWDYTAIGDSVNLAARIESLNKRYGTLILISASTKAQLDPEYITREVDCVAVKGKTEAVVLYELMGYESHPEQDVIDCFKQAVIAFHDQQLDAAKQGFAAVKEQWPEDIPTQLYLDKLSKIEIEGWESWTGVVKLSEK